jgi:hypothetical protein
MKVTRIVKEKTQAGDNFEIPTLSRNAEWGGRPVNFS